MSVPAARVDTLIERPADSGGAYVLYWMTSARRLHWNFGLQRAAEWAAKLRRPLLILDALRCDYPWCSARLHRMFLDGMRDVAQRLAGSGVYHYSYVEPRVGAGKGLLAVLARRACVVVTDDFPCTFLPRMTLAAARQVKCRFERVDSNGLLPIRSAEVALPTAYAFRRHLQRALPTHLLSFPDAEPLARLHLPPCPAPEAEVLKRWPPADAALLAGEPAALARLPIDPRVSAAALRGGETAARALLRSFVARRLNDYEEERRHPDSDAASGLSPYLHFGHVSAHEAFLLIAERENWSPERISPQCSGQRSGWWGMSNPAEAFLDELVTWREVGYNFCARRDDYDRYESLPSWARATLEAHAADAREWCYSREQFAAAATHDRVWNAAQRQLLREGRIHNYLRMLWGKKILEWSASPREALDTMVDLNNRYALDGRNPNSYSGIFWVLGRYDRPWFPERPIYGTIRYMTTASTLRKCRMERYLETYAE